METYIGTKIVQAEPAKRVDGNVYPVIGPIPFGEKVEDGYRVIYQDGYESWSPKDVFEKAYLPVVINPDLRTNAPSISQQMVDDFIATVEVQTMGVKTTVVRATLKNGFEIVEASSCVSAENYDEEFGASICLEKIKDKVWMLLGFLLQTAVNGVSIKEFLYEGSVGPDKGMSFSLALEKVKMGCRIARTGWSGKGQYVFLADDVEFDTQADLSEFQGSVDGVAVLPMLVFRTAAGNLQPGWLASQADMLAEDWVIVE